MLRKPAAKTTKKRYTPQNPQFPGIVRHAQILGVTRIHLWFVLKGLRESKTLLLRYRELKRQEAAAR
jgi:hypothetical protein